MGYTELSDTIVNESPSLLRTWWSNKNLQYDVAMSIIIIIINIAATVDMRTHNHKSPFDKDDPDKLMTLFIILYIISGIVSCIVWVMAIENVTLSGLASFYGRLSHISGFCMFFKLLSCISPHLPLLFGVPGLIWFVAALVAPCFPFIWKGLCQTVKELGDWWKYINQPQSLIDNV
ncbi:unnamed protein product [Microthlaspi erraticum]|uniref:PGG domain-containing protein n=1 Tax=Microthlaspi erraticum TaxID=1685480 RepID=A0A6D2KR23_9BRAS|nr:unnamed protein product [Microthlaspi erraticum]